MKRLSILFPVALAALALSPLRATVTVGYYTDDNTGDTGPAAPITANGFTPIRITTLATFNLGTINILMIDESNNGSPSTDFLNSATAISTWVAAGGIVTIHDRNVCQGTCTPVPGSLGISFILDQGADINVENGNNLVVNGPFGVITNSNLDGGSFSDHGYVPANTLPPGAVAFLNNGTAGHEVAFAYRYGSGLVYYSTIPLDYDLDGSNPVAFSSIYAPNMLAYVASNPFGRSVPALSEWGTALMAILLMAAGAALLARKRTRAGA